ncbi:uncharacterized protein LOC143898526 [Temnothorax americanus]|uniref:uncharacterized protein LOC143898526 n=1 Tax=Temnothorax americanus TaxID=1964332 RepID=UPI004067A27E
MAEVVMHGSFSIDTFDPATTEWNRWLQIFIAAIKIFKIPDNQKMLYLLHYVGSVAFDVICNRLAPTDPYTSTFDELTASFGEFYAPQPLEIAENFRFYQRKQKEDETIKEYVAALHKLSVHCNFGAYLKTALRNQFVFGLASQRAQSRLLETKDLTFDKAVQVATAMELSEKDARQLHTGTAAIEYLGAKSNKGEKKQPRKKSRQRSHSRIRAKIIQLICGGNHFANKCSLDRSIKCSNCGTSGHLRKVCFAAKHATTNIVEEIALLEHTEHREKYYETFRIKDKRRKYHWVKPNK